MQEPANNSSFHTKRELFSITQRQPLSYMPLIGFQISENINNNGIIYESSKPFFAAVQQ